MSKGAIVVAATAVADQQGLDAVSIRRVAAMLGVRPMSLYTHIESKDELIDLMSDELVGQMVLEALPSGDWRARLSAVARSSHATCVAHPWLLAAFARKRQPGPNAFALARQLARAVDDLRLPPRTKWMLLGIVNDYVLGHALRTETRGVGRTLGGPVTDARRAGSPDLPALGEARDADASFELGLQSVLDGVERRFLTSTGAAASSAD